MSVLKKLIEGLPEQIDAALILSDINRRYFTGFPSTAGILFVTRDQAYLLMDFRYYERAVSSVTDASVLFLEDAHKQLGDLFKKHNCRNVGIESKRITLYEYKTYCDEFPNINFLKDDQLNDFIDSMRMIKSPEEIGKILAAQKVTEAAFKHILNYVTEGNTERKIAKELDKFLLENADGSAFSTIVVSGRNSSSPHGKPSDKFLEDGDFVTMDFGASLDGYLSDMTRTVCIGQPSDEQLCLYKTVLFGQQMAIDFLKAGLKGYEADKLVREYFDSQNYKGAFGHGLGHGVGLEIHEYPMLNPKSDVVLKEGMVVTVEPGLYLSGKFGVRIEDMVEITEYGCKNLTNIDKELICL